jgi:hypothetical protein
MEIARGMSLQSSAESPRLTGDVLKQLGIRRIATDEEEESLDCILRIHKELPLKV